MSTLHHKKIGQGPPVIVLHGLFGMLDNWNSFAKSLKGDFTFYLVDQRNHGRSFHSDTMDYPSMARDVIEWMEDRGLEKAHMIGHSMGAKTLMQVAADAPENIDRAVIVDMGVRAYEPGHEEIFRALRSLDVDAVSSRTEAQEHLAKYFDSESIQLFLLKNLHRTKEGKYGWRMNLDALFNQYENILAAVTVNPPFDDPALFVKGEQSHYIRVSDWNDILESFPKAELIEIENAGHWVHAEQPDKLRTAVRAFLNGER